MPGRPSRVALHGRYLVERARVTTRNLMVQVLADHVSINSPVGPVVEGHIVGP